MDPISLAMGLAQFAPQIIRWVSGSDKAEQAARQVVDIAQAVTGKPGPEAVEALQFDAKLALEFRRAVMDHELAMDAAYLQDRQHARATHRDHWMPWVLTLTLAAMVALLVAGLFALPTPPENREVVYLIAGQLIGAFGTAVAYWLGSSRGSAQKQTLIERMQR
ncbi:hypothetical protein [Quisquiliibacterium transsilvanicum]|uniref:Holin of 3TMs, for gene-transfer release n=1 Tax=Quisquiliibacterium transsilvanicum TaxID=1549638 RepID=A0A7W8M901_9BURK|nr:hypothetical protein [Quisquiliibacterium transsilvanicum]MBB5271559.1 hypothetical protein [Quisquiliibacterium transsilvanicum]